MEITSIDIVKQSNVVYLKMLQAVSSVNRYISPCIIASGKSFTCKLYSLGASKDPWGTPSITSFIELHSPLTSAY